MACSCRFLPLPYGRFPAFHALQVLRRIYVCQLHGIPHLQNPHRLRMASDYIAAALPFWKRPKLLKKPAREQHRRACPFPKSGTPDPGLLLAFFRPGGAQGQRGEGLTPKKRLGRIRRPPEAPLPFPTPPVPAGSYRCGKAGCEAAPEPLSPGTAFRLPCGVSLRSAA